MGNAWPPILLDVNGSAGIADMHELQLHGVFMTTVRRG